MDILRRPLLTLVLLVAAPLVHAQPAALSATERQKRIDTEKELQSIAIVERKLMVPMRDGKRMAADVYRPKDPSGKVPERSSCARPTTSISGTSATARRAT